MKIVISEIPDNGLDVKCEEVLMSDAMRVVSPARVDLRVDKAGSELAVRGSIKTEVELTCSRCLRDFIRHIEVPFDVIYHPANEMKGDDRYELKAGELETGFYKDDELDIEGLIEEQVLLSIPIKPLCSESCRGICPSCGADLNETTCRCDTGKVDRRLEVLKEYFERRKK